MTTNILKKFTFVTVAGASLSFVALNAQQAQAAILTYDVTTNSLPDYGSGSGVFSFDNSAVKSTGFSAVPLQSLSFTIDGTTFSQPDDRSAVLGLGSPTADFRNGTFLGIAYDVDTTLSIPTVVPSSSLLSGTELTFADPTFTITDSQGNINPTTATYSIATPTPTPTPLPTPTPTPTPRKIKIPPVIAPRTPIPRTPIPVSIPIPTSAHIFDVTNTYDSGSGSLRQAILDANATPGADVIDFKLGSEPQTINLTTELPDITSSNLTIDGPDANLLTVNGGDFGFSTFTVSSGAAVGILNLTITGGGSGIGNSGTATVSNSNISSNFFGIDNAGTVTVSNSTIFGNYIENIDNSGTATVSNSTISISYAGIDNRGTATVSNSNISGNGYGIGNRGTATVSNSTIFYNIGDGIANSGTATVSNSTISSNSTGIGNGDGTTNVGNTIIAGNTADAYITGGNITDLGHNLIGNGDNSPFAGKNGVNGDIVGSTANPVDPKLGPLADNGSPTQTLALLSGSPAIDAGSNALIPPGVTTDQRGPGFNRIYNGTVDIGAFEVQPLSVPEPGASTWETFAFGSLLGTSLLLKRRVKK